MIEKMFIDSLSREGENLDLSIYYCGKEHCKPGHYYGPLARDHYILHYINAGKGILKINKKTYHLEKNQGFVIPPNSLAFYEADLKEPWSYYWIGFHGQRTDFYLNQAGLSLEKPVFLYEMDNQIEISLEHMFSLDQKKNRPFKLLSLFYQTLDCISSTSDSIVEFEQGKSNKEIYIEKAFEYIKKTYDRKTNIAQMANYIGVDIRYLSRIFKSHFGITPEKYTLDFKIYKACDMMFDKSLSISDISRSVGYEDPLLFSRNFKKAKGICPEKYRIQRLEGREI